MAGQAMIGTGSQYRWSKTENVKINQGQEQYTDINKARPELETRERLRTGQYTNT